MVATPGTLVVIAHRQASAWLWTSSSPFDWDESFNVASGSCGILLSAPIGGDDDMVLLLCDGKVGWAQVTYLTYWAT